MTRLKSLPLALGVLALSGVAVYGFASLPTAAGPGLDKASDASGRTVPARPDSIGAPAVDVATTEADLPDAASHGQDVSSVATSDDATPDTNKGADVSAAAKDNHGQATAASHRPAGAGKPEGAGKPDDPGVPADPGAPDGAGKPEGVPPVH
jgi:hypothetical protein